MFSSLVEKNFNIKRLIIFVLLLVLLFFVFGDIALAGEAGTGKVETKSALIEWIQLGVGVLSVFVGLLTHLITMFLSPEWINGSLFGLTAYFRQAWILVSNAVYLVFAFILIWVALMNIIGKGDDTYNLKKVLPRFIIGILIVPLSWFIIQFILSLSSILTINALNLPFSSFPDFNETLKGVEIPEKCVINLGTSKNSSTATTGSTGGAAAKTAGFIDCGSGGKIKIMDALGSDKFSDSVFGVVSTYTYGVLGLESVDKLSAESLKDVKTISDLTVQVLFDVIFIILYLVLIVALGLVLCMRGIYIWIFMIASPIFGLIYFFDKSGGVGEGFFKHMNIKEFIGLALVPVFAMAALSFGLLFMYGVGSAIGGEPTKNTSQYNEVKITKPDPNSSASLITIGQFSLEVRGAVSNDKNITGFFDKVFKTGAGIVGTLIIKLFGLIILWGTMTAALKSSDVTKELVEPLIKFGSDVGKVGRTLPQYAPILPGGASMAAMGQVGGKIQSAMTKVTSDRADKVWEDYGFGNDGAQKIAAAMKSAGREEFGPKILEIIKAIKGNADRVGSTDFKNVIQEMYNNPNISNTEREKMKTQYEAFMNNANIDTLNDFLNAFEDSTKIEVNGQAGLGRGTVEELRRAFESVAQGNQPKWQGGRSQTNNISINLGGTQSVNVDVSGVSTHDELWAKLDGLDFTGIEENEFRRNFTNQLVASGVIKRQEISAYVNAMVGKINAAGGFKPSNP